MKTAPKTTAATTLQRKATQPFFGKGGTGAFLGSSSFIQAKLTVGKPNDPYEREADQMADHVVQRLAQPATPFASPTGTNASGSPQPPLIQAKCATCEAEEKLLKKGEKQKEKLSLQTKPIFESAVRPSEDTIQRQCAHCKDEAKKIQREALSSDEPTVSPYVEGQLSASRGGGSPLPEATRRRMEGSMGADFSGVRVHTGSSAVQMSQGLNAQAFTHGRDIYFNSGKYDPNSSGGQHLLAHELTHTMQQGKFNQEHLQRQHSQAGTNRQQVACPTPGEINAIEQRYRALIPAARARGFNVAADNLQHFLTGGGTRKNLSVPWLRSFSEIIDAEHRNESRFEDQLNRLANSMAHGDNRNLSDHWDAQLTGGITTELFYASGTSIIRSTGTFSLQMIENSVSISGNVEHRWFDPYDWHGGLSAWIPGQGSFSDSDALILQSCLNPPAMPFEMEATWRRYLNGNIQIGKLWNTRRFSWNGPYP